MKLTVFLFFLLCLSCQRPLHRQTEKLCSSLDTIEQFLLLKYLDSDTIRSSSKNLPDLSSRIDSIVKLSEDYPVAERISVLYAGIKSSMYYSQLAQSYEEQIVSLLPNVSISSLQAPLKLQLLECYTFLNSIPQEERMKAITNLLFNLEYKHKLSASEQIFFLNLKARIYSIQYNEYNSALQFTEKARAIAQQEGLNRELFDTYKEQLRIFVAKDSLPLQLEISKRQAELIEKTGVYKERQNQIYQYIAYTYFNLKNYREALQWFRKIPPKPRFNSRLVEIYINLDSTSQAFTALENLRQTDSKTPVNTISHLYLEAKIWEKAGEPDRYEKCLYESQKIYDLNRKSYILGHHFAHPEEYAHLLWKQGKRQQAIARMDIILEQLANYRYYTSTLPFSMKTSVKHLENIHLIAEYYHQAGLNSKAWKTYNLYDSLRTVSTQTQIKHTRQSIIQKIYATELKHALELQKTNLSRYLLLLRFTFVLLGIFFLLVLLFYFLYRQRQRQLDSLYTRQKEIEHLQESAAENTTYAKDIPADKQLFQRLEEQLHREKLFLNPDFSRDDLCQLIGSNRMYVSTCINKYAEMNINQWINKARVGHAIRLIRSGESNLRILAQASGFASTTSFFRNFKRYTLLTPSQYIEREKER